MTLAGAAEEFQQLLSKSTGSQDVEEESRRIAARGNHVDDFLYKVVLGIRINKLKHHSPP